MKVAIIGCGVIGQKRARALDPEDQLVACCDISLEKAEALGKAFSCPFYTEYTRVFNEVECDAVIVAVINQSIQEIVLSALHAGKHVLSEKPLGRNASEAKTMVEVASQSHRILKTGFNHRFHPAVWKAKEIFDQGGIGELLIIRARYGHGGRPGLEKEWRSSKLACGGGELLDQGVHVIDLIRWFGGEITEVYGKVETKFWPIEVEDNAFAIVQTEKHVTAQFHVSWTNWKNIFSFELFGSLGYLKIEGLGGNYGPETLEYGKRNPKGGRPEMEYFEFPPEDTSWKSEWQEFKSAIRDNREPLGSGVDGWKANAVVEALYQSHQEKKGVRLK